MRGPILEGLPSFEIFTIQEPSRVAADVRPGLVSQVAAQSANFASQFAVCKKISSAELKAVHPQKGASGLLQGWASQVQAGVGRGQPAGGEAHVDGQQEEEAAAPEAGTLQHWVGHWSADPWASFPQARDEVEGALSENHLHRWPGVGQGQAREERAQKDAGFIEVHGTGVLYIQQEDITSIGCAPLLQSLPDVEYFVLQAVLYGY
eukprot:s10662_g1.t2